jgi:uncharacterized Zn-finger protein
MKASACSCVSATNSASYVVSHARWSARFHGTGPTPQTLHPRVWLDRGYWIGAGSASKTSTELKVVPST